MEWLLIRHGSAHGQEPEAPLTEEGRQEATALARVLLRLGPEQVVTSPYRRAWETITPFLDRSGVPVQEDERLRERVLSPHPRKDWMKQLQASFVDFDHCLPGGESNRQAMERGVSVLKDWERSGAGKVAIVTHGGLFTLLLHSFDHQYGFETWQKLSNPDLYRVVTEENKTVITRLWE